MCSRNYAVHQSNMCRIKSSLIGYVSLIQPFHSQECSTSIFSLGLSPEMWRKVERTRLTIPCSDTESRLNYELSRLHSLISNLKGSENLRYERCKDTLKIRSCTELGQSSCRPSPMLPDTQSGETLFRETGQVLILTSDWYV